jgi:hypothetical protein
LRSLIAALISGLTFNIPVRFPPCNVASCHGMQLLRRHFLPRTFSNSCFIEFDSTSLGYFYGPGNTYRTIFIKCNLSAHPDRLNLKANLIVNCLIRPSVLSLGQFLALIGPYVLVASRSDPGMDIICWGYSVSPGILQFPELRITPYWRYRSAYLRTLYFTHFVSVLTYAHHHRLARP